MIFHIRAPKPRVGQGNRWYPVAKYHATKTLCGAPITDRDNRFSWQQFPEPIGEYEPCPKCLALHAASKSNRPLAVHALPLTG